MPVQNRSILLSVFFLAVLGLGFGLGIQMERQRSEQAWTELEETFGASGSGVTFQTDPESEVDMTLLWTVWRLLDRHYVTPEDLTIQKLRNGAVRGLVEAVGDGYSAFLTPSESNDFQQVLAGKLEGIGAELAQRDGQIVVVAPLKKSPAAQAGLLPKDVILSVDGASLDGIGLQDAVDRIRGERGSEVLLTVYRPSTMEEIDLRIVRDEIHVPMTENEVLYTATGAIGYIAINQFGDGTVEEARRVLKDFHSTSLSGVILDLRFNGGGYLEGSIDLVSLFLSTGKVVSVQRRGEEVQSHFVRGGSILPDIPLVVLINEGSASASEIVAGALQDHGRGKILGMQSFGKGTVQEVIELPGGSSLRVTVAKWLTPSGRAINEKGITPDIEVPVEVKDVFSEEDIQRDAAVEWLLDGDVPMQAVSEKPTAAVRE